MKYKEPTTQDQLQYILEEISALNIELQKIRKVLEQNLKAKS